MATAASRQPGAWAGTAKDQCAAGQQTGHRTRLGSEGNLSLLRALQVRRLGRGLPRLLVLPGNAGPAGADEESGTHVALTRAAHPELVSSQRRDLLGCRRGPEQQDS